MSRKPLLLLVIAASLAWSVHAAQDQAETKPVERALRQLNDAFAKGNADAIRAMMTDDHRAVTTYYGGPVSRDGQLKLLPDLKFTEYKTGEVTVRMLGKGVALVTFPQTMKGTFRGKDLPVKSFASAIYIERDGAWREAFYQETPL